MTTPVPTLGYAVLDLNTNVVRAVLRERETAHRAATADRGLILVELVDRRALEQTGTSPQRPSSTMLCASTPCSQAACKSWCGGAE